MATKKSASTAAATAAAPALAPKKAAPAKKAATAASTAAPAKKAAPKKKAAVTTPPVAPAITVEVLQDQIRVEAYGYYIERGYRPGDPTADWHRAEDAVLRRHGLR